MTSPSMLLVYAWGRTSFLRRKLTQQPWLSPRGSCSPGPAASGSDEGGPASLLPPGPASRLPPQVVGIADRLGFRSRWRASVHAQARACVPVCGSVRLRTVSLCLAARTMNNRKAPRGRALYEC